MKRKFRPNRIQFQLFNVYLWNAVHKQLSYWRYYTHCLKFTYISLEKRGYIVRALHDDATNFAFQRLLIIIPWIQTNSEITFEHLHKTIIAMRRKLHFAENCIHLNGIGLWDFDLIAFPINVYEFGKHNEIIARNVSGSNLLRMIIRNEVKIRLLNWKAPFSKIYNKLVSG